MYVNLIRLKDDDYAICDDETLAEYAKTKQWPTRPFIHLNRATLALIHADGVIPDVGKVVRIQVRVYPDYEKGVFGSEDAI